MHPNPKELYDFVAIGELADTTKQFIHLSLAHNIRRRDRTGLAHVEQLVLQQARDYLSRVREGFVLSVRTTDVGDRQEIAYLLERVILDWEALSRELDLSLAAPEERGTDEHPAPEFPAQEYIERVRDQLLAFGMAAIALGMLPRLPQEQVTFPKSYSRPPTYADIPVPHSPAAMLQRIEEIEKMVWQITAHDLVELAERHYDPLRRTYGFFESSAWLARQETLRFGLKRSRHDSLL